MISRRVVWSIVIGVAAVLIMTWRMASFPARVVIINQSGTAITRVSMKTENGQLDFGTIQNGESRRVSIDPTPSLQLTFHSDAGHTWRAAEAVTAGQSVVLYVTPDNRVVQRSRIGSLVR